MRPRIKNKKAMNERLYIAITSIILVLVVGITFLVKVGSTKDNVDYALDYYTKDLALIVEAMQAVPGDVRLDYPLEQGFYVSITAHAVKVAHTPTGQSKEHPLHLLPGMSVKDSDGDELLELQKAGGTITIKMPDARPQPQGCPKATGLEGKQLSYELKVITGQGSLSTTDLHTLKDELELSFKMRNIPEHTTSLTNHVPISVTVTTEQARTPKGEIIIRRPYAADDLENDYESIFCAFTEHLQQDLAAMPFIITEDVTTYTSTKHHFTISAAISPNDRAAFTADADTYAEAFVKAITEAGGSTP
ncbi:hypothetical protein JXA12_02495 [Candidatus Woesearchaeota archaeon]|nr:hypothetical protein [Candidatus Woesearchaeota archaeon]